MKPGMIIRNTCWQYLHWMVTGDMNLNGVIVLRALKEHMPLEPGIDFWKPQWPRYPSNMELNHVFGVDDWMVVPTRWVSPLEMRSRGYTKDDSGVMLQSVDDEKTLLQAAADECFYDIPLTVLTKLAKYLNAPQPKGTDLFPMCRHLIRFAYKYGDKPDDVVLMTKLDKRTWAKDSQNLWKHKEAIALLEKHDQKLINEQIAQEQLDEVQLESFEMSLLELRGQLQPALRDLLSKLKVKSPAERTDAITGEVKRRFPGYMKKIFPNVCANITQEQAQSLMPPEGGIYKYIDWNLWVCRMGPLCRSRSITFHGFHNALMMLLRWSWKLCMHANGMTVLDCPVRGIFPPRTGDIVADANSIATAEVIR
jgi:hypothetical protein